MYKQQNYELIYFRQYSDFSFCVEKNFIITVSENEYGMTEIYAEIYGVSRKIIVFRQCALTIFRELSPNQFIEKYYEYIKQLYHKKCCLNYRNLDDIHKTGLFG